MNGQRKIIKIRVILCTQKLKIWRLKIKPNVCLCIHPLTEVSGSLLHHLLYSKADRMLFLTLLRLHQSFFRRSTWSWSLSICLLFPTPTWWRYYYSNERERGAPAKKATRRSGRKSLGGWLFFWVCWTMGRSDGRNGRLRQAIVCFHANASTVRYMKVKCPIHGFSW